MNELILPSNKLSVLQKFFKSDQFPNLLFYGPAGVGKTSTILACAKEYYGDNSK